MGASAPHASSSHVRPKRSRKGVRTMEANEISGASRALIEAARAADGPSAADRARIDAAFTQRLAALGVHAALPSGATVSTGAAHGAVWLKGSALTALVLATGSVWFVATSRPSPEL